MTTNPTEPQNGPQAPQDAALEDLRRQAMADESQAMMEATVRALQERVVTLNVEVRVRDQRIIDLEQELAEAQVTGPDSGEPGA